MKILVGLFILMASQATFAGFGGIVYIKGRLEGISNTTITLRASNGKLYRISRKALPAKFDTRPLTQLLVSVTKKDFKSIQVIFNLLVGPQLPRPVVGIIFNLHAREGYD